MNIPLPPPFIPALVPAGHPRNPVFIGGQPYIRVVVDAHGHQIYSLEAPLRLAIQDQPGLPYRLLVQHGGGVRSHRVATPKQLASLAKAHRVLAIKRGRTTARRI